MVISTSSWIYWWAYLPDRLMGVTCRVRHTSLCVLFWRCVLLAPILLGSILVVKILMSIAYTAVWILSSVMLSDNKVSELFGTYANAMKSKVCPLIIWKEEEVSNGSEY